MNLILVKSSIVGCLVLSSVLSHAASFPCDQSVLCKIAFDFKPNTKQIRSEKVLKNQPLEVSHSQNNAKIDALTFYLKQLQLTPEQYLALHKIQQSQVPHILLSMCNLEEAHTHN